MVGAPRAATTSLYHYLRQHPQIFAPSIKEPHFFSHPEVTDTYYPGASVSREQEYRDLYGGRRDGQKSGDFSTSYLSRTEAAGRIRRWNPSARIMMVLRNPVERAVSHYLMDVRDGYTTQSMAALIDAAAPDPRFRREYVDVGRYHDQVTAYLEHFPAEQMKVVLFEDIAQRRQETVRDVLRFLDVDDSAELDLSEVRNAAAVPRSSVARRLRRSGVAKLVARRTSQPVRTAARAVLARDVPPELVDDGTRVRLHEIFAGDTAELAALIGRDLSSWSQPGSGR